MKAFFADTSEPIAVQQTREELSEMLTEFSTMFTPINVAKAGANLLMSQALNEVAFHDGRVLNGTKSLITQAVRAAATADQIEFRSNGGVDQSHEERVRRLSELKKRMEEHNLTIDHEPQVKAIDFDKMKEVTVASTVDDSPQTTPSPNLTAVPVRPRLP